MAWAHEFMALAMIMLPTGTSVASSAENAPMANRAAITTPEPAAIEAAAALDVPAVELHTGRYAHSWRQSDRALEELAAAARRARSLGLAVHAGHGLTYLNVEPVAQILEIEELNIGHSIMSRAILTGMSEAVTTMGRLVRGARRSATGAA